LALTIDAFTAFTHEVSSDLGLCGALGFSSSISYAVCDFIGQGEPAPTSELWMVTGQ
jgi:hypothetical protein